VLPGTAVTDILGYVAMSSGIVAAIMVSVNVGRRVTGYGFAVFLLSSLIWIAYAFLGDDQPLIIQNGVLAVINVLGVYRWLILKAPG
jgi:type IV secretory pathway TrbD component